jgi:hypothetical protein
MRSRLKWARVSRRRVSPRVVRPPPPKTGRVVLTEGSRTGWPTLVSCARRYLGLRHTLGQSIHRIRHFEKLQWNVMQKNNSFDDEKETRKFPSLRQIFHSYYGIFNPEPAPTDKKMDLISAGLSSKISIR